MIGHPVNHSRSPWIHARFAEQSGQHLRYIAIDSPVDGFAATLERLRAEGYGGANVTVPFKLEAFAAADVRSTRAELAQAANTLVWRQEAEGMRLHADNTDGAGLMRDIRHNAGVALAGRHVLLLGAGGASAGVLGALLAETPASVTVANRSVGKAEQLVQQHAAVAAEHGVQLRACALAAVLEDAPLLLTPQIAMAASAQAAASPLPSSAATPAHAATDNLDAFDIILNGTASSLGGTPLLLPARRFASGALAYDMMYGAAALPFLQHAQACGATSRDGLGMLVEQAALAFALWRGVTPDTTPVLAELRALVDAPANKTA